MRFIKLTTPSGVEVYVAPEEIAIIGRFEKKASSIYPKGHDTPFTVRETPDEIRALIGGEATPYSIESKLDHIITMLEANGHE